MRAEAVYRKIYNDILAKIQDGRLKEGEKVPTELELAGRYGVSRISSKRALDELAAGGYLRRVAGQGSFVAIPKERPKLLGLSLSNFNQLFGMEFIKGVYYEAEQLGYGVVMKTGYFTNNHELQALNHLVDTGVEGIICIPLYEGESWDRNLQRVVERCPLVFADRTVWRYGVPLVCSDNRRATAHLCWYLANLGHQKIVFVSSKPDSTVVRERLEGFLEGMHLSAAPPAGQAVFTGIRSTLPGMNQPQNNRKDMDDIAAFLRDNPGTTAIIAHTYQVAQLVRKTVESMWLKVPEDISIVCFDAPYRELGETEFFAHVQQNEFEMGTQSVRILQKRLEGKPVDEVTYVTTTLMAGESCRAVRTR